MNPEKTYLFASGTDFDKPGLTGAHRRFIELVESFSHSSKIILLAHPCKRFADNPNIFLIPLEKKKASRLPDHLKVMLEVLRTLRKNKRNIVCDYAVSFGTVPSICYRFAGIKHIVSLFREDLIGYQKALGASWPKIKYFQLQEILAVKFSERIIVQCTNDRNNLISRNQKHCRGVAEKTLIQLNNVNASWMMASPANKAEESAGGYIKILFVGNFSDCRKGHHLLLPAVSRLLEQGEKLKLFVIGDGREREVYQKRFEKYEDIVFLGRINGIEEYLQQADIMIVPSLIDSCPNTVLEGLSAELATYGSNTGGIPDILKDSSYMFEPDENSIYTFLKQKLEEKKYIEDKEKQKNLVRELSFDWAGAVEEKIQGRFEEDLMRK